MISYQANPFFKKQPTKVDDFEAMLALIPEYQSVTLSFESANYKRYTGWAAITFNGFCIELSRYFHRGPAAICCMIPYFLCILLTLVLVFPITALFTCLFQPCLYCCFRCSQRDKQVIPSKPPPTSLKVHLIFASVTGSARYRIIHYNCKELYQITSESPNIIQNDFVLKVIENCNKTGVEIRDKNIVNLLRNLPTMSDKERERWLSSMSLYSKPRMIDVRAAESA